MTLAEITRTTQSPVTKYVDEWLLNFIHVRRIEAYALCDRILAVADADAGNALLDQLGEAVSEIRVASSLLDAA